MLKGLMLANSAFQEIFDSWEKIGFFDLLFPFLLIFALVFGILTRIKIFKDNKAVNVIIALVIALMALQFEGVPRFFSEIFPRVGIGLIIILVLLILTGLFADPDSSLINYILLGISVIIAIVVLVQTAGSFGWSSGQWWMNNWPMIAGVIVILIFVIVIVSASSSGKSTAQKKDYKPWWARD